MSKYELLKDYRTTSYAGKINYIPKGTIATEQDGIYYFPTFRGKTWIIDTRVLENNPAWFRKIEEPFISEGEEYWWMYGDGDVGKELYIPPTSSYPEFHNCFPTRLFTREEVEAISEEVKAVFKKHQDSKK